MVKVLLLLVFIFFTATNLFSEEIYYTDDSTRIMRGMVSPTQSAEAMEAYNTGNYFLHHNNFEEAEIYFLRAIALDNNFVDAMDHLGLVYRNLGRYDHAEHWYLRSIEINPNNIVPYLNLAVAYRFQGRLEDARQKYLQARNLDPDDPEPYFGIGMVYQSAGHYEVSLEFISIAMQIYLERESMLLFNAFFAQGNNYYSMENYEDALRLYKAALVGHPDNAFIQNRIIEIEGILYE